MLRQIFCKRKRFVLRKRRIFQLMQSQLIKKSFFQHTTATLFYHAQTNVQLQISSTKPYCELAVGLLFFETSQSCVSAMVTLSHRFKSSPAIFGKVVIPGVAGYLMNAGHFYESHVSSGDLNRPRSPEVRKPLACFLVLFARRKKNKTVPFAGSFEVLQTSNQLTKATTSHKQN